MQRPILFAKLIGALEQTGGRKAACFHCIFCHASSIRHAPHAAGIVRFAAPPLPHGTRFAGLPRGPHLELGDQNCGAALRRPLYGSFNYLRLKKASMPGY